MNQVNSPFSQLHSQLFKICWTYFNWTDYTNAWGFKKNSQLQDMSDTDEFSEWQAEMKKRGEISKCEGFPNLCPCLLIYLWIKINKIVSGMMQKEFIFLSRRVK